MHKVRIPDDPRNGRRKRPSVGRRPVWLLGSLGRNGDHPADGPPSQPPTFTGGGSGWPRCKAVDEALPRRGESHAAGRTRRPTRQVGRPQPPTNQGARTSATTLMSFIRMFIEGPEVSLNGSPTVSPTTAALWAGEPFPPMTPPSMYFLA